jgi:flagellar basal-body rod protein FlgB
MHGFKNGVIFLVSAKIRLENAIDESESGCWHVFCSRRPVQTLFIFEWIQNMAEVNNIMDVIEAGLKAETVRQKAIATNVANLQTPGYRSVDIRFEALLEKAMKNSDPLELADIESELYEPGTTPVQSNGNDVSLEVEVGKLVKNTLRQKAYIRLLQTKYRQMSLAMNVG